jgi:predicted  nucleic acid-binding Zn-ribbon protein
LFFKEKKSLFDELETTKNQYAECNNELIRLQELVERVQTEKAKLNRRVSKLVYNGNFKKRSFI